jgi:hypothetical protein
VIGIVARRAVVVAAVNRRRARGTLAGVRLLDIERDSLVGPAGIALHQLAFGGVRSIEVRIGADARRAIEAAHGRESRRVVGVQVGAEFAAGAHPGPGAAAVDGCDLLRSRGHEVMAEGRVVPLDGRAGRFRAGAGRKRDQGRREQGRRLPHAAILPFEGPL